MMVCVLSIGTEATEPCIPVSAVDVGLGARVSEPVPQMIRPPGSLAGRSQTGLLRRGIADDTDTDLSRPHGFVTGCYRLGTQMPEIHLRREITTIRSMCLRMLFVRRRSILNGVRNGAHRGQEVTVPIITPLIAANVQPDVEFSGAAYALEIGGLMFLMAAVVAIVLGVLWGGDENAAGGRTVGYGVAMAAAAGISLYLSTVMGGTPLATASEATWLYPLTAIVGCMLYVSRTIQRSTKPRGSQRARSQAVNELFNNSGSRTVSEQRARGSHVRRRGPRRSEYRARP